MLKSSGNWRDFAVLELHGVGSEGQEELQDLRGELGKKELVVVPDRF